MDQPILSSPARQAGGRKRTVLIQKGPVDPARAPDTQGPGPHVREDLRTQQPPQRRRLALLRRGEPLDSVHPRAPGGAQDRRDRPGGGLREDQHPAGPGVRLPLCAGRGPRAAGLVGGGDRELPLPLLPPGAVPGRPGADACGPAANDPQAGKDRHAGQALVLLRGGGLLLPGVGALGATPVPQAGRGLPRHGAVPGLALSPPRGRAGPPFWPPSPPRRNYKLKVLYFTFKRYFH